MSVLRNPLAVRWDPDLMWEKAGLRTPFVRPNGAPTKITFGDMDLLTERNGHFLFIEGKRQDEEPSLGQEILLKALVRDGHTVLVIYGDPPTDIRELRWWGQSERQPSSVEDFHAQVSAWFAVVDELTPRHRDRP
jgi:hypothetical protein